MIRAALLLVLLLAALPTRAEEVVLGLSRDDVSITATFEGSDILIFGAVKREAPPPDTAGLEVVVTVEGPREPLTVRRKDRVFGIWMNVEAMSVDLAPSFYAVATSAPLRDALTWTEDLRQRISVTHAIRTVGETEGISDPEGFREALVRIRSVAGSYQLLEGGVELSEDTLFSTSISLPANLTEGPYAVRVFLTRNGQTVDIHEGVITVRKVGLERLIYETAQNQPLLYGLLSLLIAITAGWAASAAFRALQ
ncbi:TIGR02186 family protein [Histidinibacterium lentulum]|uniref:TIGR02186 family protein n=1 Tax=Histidinibacterium lentulum TaxID=2480588 RepID=A0A3N2R0Z0_9RHOB|nr:TIGR02186 family protein [Histidinibacterium lentulum]ROU01135.1 hypothetical protein EAT49_11465 [Histidinibacterium lentulum]